MAYPFIAYDNIMGSGVTATDTGSGSVDNIYDLRPYTNWTAASFGTKYLTMDYGADVEAGSLCIYSHNLGTASATVSLESSGTGAWAGEEVEQIAGFVPTNDRALAKTFTAATAQYWRVKIVTAAIAPTVGCLMVSGQMTFPVYPESPLTRESQSVNATTPNPRGAHFFGLTNYYTPLEIAVSFPLPYMYFIDGEYNQFWINHGKKCKPFFWVPNITDYPNAVFFVNMRPGAQRSNKQNDFVYSERLDLNFVGVAE